MKEFSVNNIEKIFKGKEQIKRSKLSVNKEKWNMAELIKRKLNIVHITLKSIT